MDGLTVLKYKEHIWDLGCSYRSKAKPVLLLSVFSLIHDHTYKSNRILPNKVLIDSYHENWEKYNPGIKATPINYPLYHLSTDKFWHIIELPGKEVKPAHKHSPSMKDIRECVDYFCVDDDLFEQLQDDFAFEMLTQTLIEKHLN